MKAKNLLMGERVRLAALTPKDIPTIAVWHQDGEFMRLFDARPAYPQTEESLTKWLERQQKTSDLYIFTIRTLEDDVLLGFIELEGILWAHGVCAMSYVIGDPGQRGKGYGYEATQLALTFAFHELNLHRVTVTAYSYNETSNALAQKLGFQREGAFREFLHRDGKRHDMYLYGLLRHEWEAHRRQGGGDDGR